MDQPYFQHWYTRVRRARGTPAGKAPHDLALPYLKNDYETIEE